MRPTGLGLLLLVLAGCPEEQRSPKPVSAPAKAQPPKSALATTASYELAVYWPKRPPAGLAALVKDDAIRLEEADMAKYAPPSPEMLAYFGRGLSDAQVDEVQKVESATRFVVEAPADRALEVLKHAGEAVDAAARKGHGFPWDESTRELFTPDAWTKRRIDGWIDGRPDVQTHIVSHLYDNGRGNYRLVTLGMQKLALPDLSIDSLPNAFAKQLQVLVNLTAAHLMRHSELPPSGALDFPLETVDGGTSGRGKFRLVSTKPQEGDAPNALLRFEFEGQGSLTERQSQALLLAFGSGESPLMHARATDEELNAARDRARAKLPQVKARFPKMKGNLESLNVKAPFGEGDSREYMWVEVKRWKGDRIEGTLVNEPYYNPQLQRGSPVTVDVSDVFDWHIFLRDGGTEGAETEEILKRMQE